MHIDLEESAVAWSDDSRLQPNISPEDVADFDDSAAARHVAQLAADQTIMLALSTEGFGGEAWALVARALIEYGWSVMRAWLVTGEVFRKCREKHLGGTAIRMPAAGLERSEALSLADDSVTEAVLAFQGRVLARGQWDPSKGATLATFFIGNCLLQFVNLWRARHRYLRRNVVSGLLDTDPRSRGPSGPEVTVLEVMAGNRRSDEVLAPIRDSVNRSILRLVADGYSLDEISELLELDYKQVEARLYRARRKLRALQDITSRESGAA